MKLHGIADLLYGAYNRHDAAAVAELYDGNGTHEDIAMGHSKVGQTAIADGLQKFSIGFRMPTGPRTCRLQIHSDR